MEYKTSEWRLQSWGQVRLVDQDPKMPFCFLINQLSKVCSTGQEDFFNLAIADQKTKTYPTVKTPLRVKSRVTTVPGNMPATQPGSISVPLAS